ncbi:WecB/TagA/CpsF family glycosyltransferase [Novosphingobium sp. FKTRR1]|uniref:WecB/TagA/CpsF family glycosyltransferase n=1 Tax=Novosphingobium sp. FKTRR1 TaxID=2879118 RepID=UPI001CF0A635|nr:WecB/TagA/CpsF family glycosyltransferase [Novosphingobium sp. FKTRR1]
MLKRFDFETYSGQPDARFTPAARRKPFGDTLRQTPRARLFGLELMVSTRAHVAEELVAMAKAGECATVQFINAHCVNVAQTNRTYREVLDRADFLLPDGSGLTIAARLAGTSLGENLNGTDLFPELCRCAAERGQSIFLLGGKQGIAAAAAQAMQERYPALQVAGTRHGYWSASEEDRVVAQINASGAAIVLVGLGVPTQEIWIDRIRDRLMARVVMGVGGLFDYYSGSIPRAPAALRKIGCEWIWRLAQEPRRLFVRYVLGNPLFLAASVLHAWQARDLSGRASLALKHGIDRIAAGMALLLLAPLLLLVSAAIRLEDGGPVFFRQTRIGANGRPFRMWKFRSMVIDAEARLAAIRERSERDGTCFKMKHDPRVTRVGAALRRLSLDELPQLINIFAGDMSVVGPRPALPREVVGYQPDARARLMGKPGLTCTWQVSGRANVPFEQQVELDVKYLRSRSILADLALIVRTVPAVITARGAY